MFARDFVVFGFVAYSYDSLPIRGMIFRSIANEYLFAYISVISCAPSEISLAVTVS